MLTALKSVKFARDLQINGKMMNKSIHPGGRDKGVKLDACYFGVIVTMDDKPPVIVPWALVETADAVSNFDDLLLSVGNDKPPAPKHTADSVSEAPVEKSTWGGKRK